MREQNSVYYIPAQMKGGPPLPTITMYPTTVQLYAPDQCPVSSFSVKDRPHLYGTSAYTLVHFDKTVLTVCDIG